MFRIFDLSDASALASEVAAGRIEPCSITNDTISQHLSTHSFPDPELLIRTGGEYRVSNFLLYQIAYAELFFSDVRWPDFRKENLYDAILDYQSRQRRFGKTGGQIQEENQQKK
ncbi:MAG: hypothetical protein EOO01_05800 [Chitinophagaceae bacterium]|nr:MAG: hypothetical protein EOO01_05800 [Chitinophagaceae bacterium]